MTVELSPAMLGNVSAVIQYQELPDPVLPSNVLGTITSPNPPIVQEDQAIRVDFTITQMSFPWILFPGATYQCNVIVEQMGGGEFNLALPAATFAISGPSTFTYPTASVNIPAGSLPQGLYKIIALVDLVYTAGGTTLTPVCGFEELGTVRIVSGQAF